MTVPLPQIPTVRYARSGAVNIAYQVFGDGPIDLVLVPGFISHIEIAWQEPLLARFLRRLSAFTRVIAFDKRGMGLSDRDPDRETPTIRERVLDIAAVMDSAGSETAALLAWSEGGPTAVTFAHEYPARTAALVLLQTTARFSSTHDYPDGIPREILEIFIDTVRDEWGSGVAFELYAPSLADDRRARAWWESYQRFATTPGAVEASLRMHLDVDVRPLLADLTVRTLVVHRTHDMVIPVECGRYLGSHIPGAEYIERDSQDHMYWVGGQDELLDDIRRMLSDTTVGAALKRLRRPHRRASFGWESLTAAELDVVRLVANGMTNQQISSRLTISPRTVQTHVTNVLRKLDLSRRAELAAEATRHTIS